MGTFLIRLSGAQPELLERAPTDRNKYVGLGSAILITAAVASVSMTFALTTALKAPLPVAIPFALAWGLAIISLDRWLVVSLQRQASIVRYSLLALIRLALALLIGFIVSTPFVLQIFRPEIENQLDLIHSQRATAFAAHPPLAQTIKTDRAQEKSLENLVTTGGNTAQNPSKDPSVVALVRQRNQATSRESYWDNDLNCQKYGIPFGHIHCRAGNGKLARIAQHRLTRYTNEANALNKKVNHQIAVVTKRTNTGKQKTVNAAQTALTKAQDKLSTDLATQRRLSAEFVSTNGNNSGLLIRLLALGQLTNRNGTLNAARWLLFALFTVIECLPLLVKTLLNFGPENSYEKVVRHEEKMRLQVAEATAVREQAAGMIEADSILDEAQQLADRREPMIQEISERAIDAERKVALAWIEDWEARQLRDVGRASPHLPWKAYIGNGAASERDPASEPGPARGQDETPDAAQGRRGWPDDQAFLPRQAGPADEPARTGPPGNGTGPPGNAGETWPPGNAGETWPPGNAGETWPPGNGASAEPPAGQENPAPTGPLATLAGDGAAAGPGAGGAQPFRSGARPGDPWFGYQEDSEEELPPQEVTD